MLSFLIVVLINVDHETQHGQAQWNCHIQTTHAASALQN